IEGRLSFGRCVVRGYLERSRRIIMVEQITSCQRVSSLFNCICLGNVPEFLEYSVNLCAGPPLSRLAANPFYQLKRVGLRLNCWVGLKRQSDGIGFRMEAATSDEQIVERALTGDAQPFGQSVRAGAPRVSAL